MPLEAVGLLTVVVAVAVAAAFAALRGGSKPGPNGSGLPEALRDARMVHAERTFRSPSRGLVARLDRAYELGGELVLVEFKTRGQDKVFMVDVIELSVQRVALRDESRMPVSKSAWVVVHNTATGHTTSHRVSLLSTEQVLQLRGRYLDVESGQGAPAGVARSEKQCVGCGHRSVCGRKRAQPNQ